jgi:hypothetical protein
MTNDEITKAILGYLLRHPDAGDTLEGIAEWWIRMEKIEIEIQQVSSVVASLVEQGLLLQKTVNKKNDLYCLNKKMIPNLNLILKQ